MPMFRRGFRSGRNRGFVRRVRKIARGANAITLVKRCIFSGLTIPDVTAADWDNPLNIDLAVAQEGATGVQEDVESDGTSVATVPVYSRLTSLKLDLKILGATSTTNVYRWWLHKLPDGEELSTDATRLIGNNFHSSDDAPTQREQRKYIMAKGMVITNPNTAVTNLRVFVRKSAIERVARMSEQDVIRFDIAKDTAGTTSLLHGFGSLYFRANG